MGIEHAAVALFGIDRAQEQTLTDLNLRGAEQGLEGLPGCRP